MEWGRLVLTRIYIEPLGQCAKDQFAWSQFGLKCQLLKIYILRVHLWLLRIKSLLYLYKAFWMLGDSSYFTYF